MPDSQTWTIGRLLEWTSRYLQQQGSKSARLDAEILLAESLQRPRIELYTSYDEEPAAEARDRFREFVRRRAAGEPVAYLVGRREFYSLSFEVTPDVLIPRPETEHLVIAILDLAKASGDNHRQLTIADVGTGSGAIAVSVAKHLPSCYVTATDVSPAALEVARSNASRHELGDRIEFVQADLLQGLPADQRFDIIATNPPYVSENEIKQTSPDVHQYEPHLALVAGPRGDELLARLVPQAAERLAAGGWFLSEISPMIEGRVQDLLVADGRFETPSTVKDLAGLPRVISARRHGG
jgi:release factor glutamine methyltransferase